MIHLDTSLLVDLLRETARGTTGPATRLLDTIQEEDLWISVCVACELHAGAELSAHPAQERRRVERLCSSLHVAYPDERFPPTYGRLLAWQQRRGERISTMDLLIATAAVVAGAPLATRNVKDFSRVPGLELLRY
jgi:predicted nucleic acid-binding protein